MATVFESLKEYVTPAFENYGFKAELSASMYDASWVINIYKQFKIDRADIIAGSDISAIKAITDSIDKEVKKVEEMMAPKIKELEDALRHSKEAREASDNVYKQEIRRLQEYETYYTKHYEMQHAKKYEN